MFNYRGSFSVENSNLCLISLPTFQFLVIPPTSKMSNKFLRASNLCLISNKLSFTHFENSRRYMPMIDNVTNNNVTTNHKTQTITTMYKNTQD